MNTRVRRLLDHFPIFEIPQLLDDGTERVYLRRWFLKGTPHSKDRRIMLHEILLSDQGRDLHDHPASFISVGLKGTYTETTPEGVKTFKAPWIRHLSATQLHRLELENGSVWTLIFWGKKRREWGFQTPDGWVHWEDYVANAVHVPESSKVVRVGT